MTMTWWTGLFVMGLLVGVCAANAAESAPSVTVADQWQVRVSPGVVKIGRSNVRIAAPVTLTVAPSESVHVTDERYDSLPVFDPNGAPWAKGVKLRGLVTHETSAADMLVPDSFVLKRGPGASPKFTPGVDYDIERKWATVGRLASGAIKPDQPVWADYSFGRGRIDSIVADRRGAVTIRQGIAHNATPLPPPHSANEAVIANIWVPGRLAALSNDSLYPIVEAQYPESTNRRHPAAERLLPQTWARLTKGEPLNIIAWGDSVTDGGQASDEAHRYQSRFAEMLRKRFPASAIKLTTVAWGGRNSDSFLNEPPGSPHNFEEKVLRARPNLVVMEFVNDAFMSPEQVEQKYSALLERFKAIGAEWIILTPHYVRPDWMGQTSVRVETDPRPYVLGVRQFAQRHNVALADASLRWGHLVKEGIPYITLLSNSINHPDDRGHEMFARSLMEIFGGP